LIGVSAVSATEESSQATKVGVYCDGAQTGIENCFEPWLETISGRRDKQDLLSTPFTVSNGQPVTLHLITRESKSLSGLPRGGFGQFGLGHVWESRQLGPHFTPRQTHDAATPCKASVNEGSPNGVGQIAYALFNMGNPASTGHAKTIAMFTHLQHADAIFIEGNPHVPRTRSL
jgi:hypothetical protein